MRKNENRKNKMVYNLGEENGEEGVYLSLLVVDMASVL